MTHAVTPSAAARLFESPQAKLARTLLTVLAGAALVTLAAKTQIPFWPVPMTLHTLAVMALAVAFGPRVAVSILLTYLASGVAGLPVFSGAPERGVGLAYMAGPTGGYLLGYLAAAGAVGALARGASFLGRVGAMLVGLALVYLLGVAWLAVFVPVDKLLAVGVAPFLLGDLLKIGVVAVGGALLPGLRGWVKGVRS
ncbi:biotin transporter BioY [Azospirillum sp.]|uniref:biotin transporter BioY n=1 Tax=Azospirillum sp. TaxID=34012 RepID=UPI002635EE30|nr:biotin transporter BioY [Azospirillum sp.]